MVSRPWPVFCGPALRRLTVDGVAAGEDRRVVARTTHQAVVARPADQHVISAAADERVVGVEPGQRVVAGAANQQVRVPIAGQVVVAGAAGQVLDLDHRKRADDIARCAGRCANVLPGAGVERDPEIGVEARQVHRIGPATALHFDPELERGERQRVVAVAERDKARPAEAEGDSVVAVLRVDPLDPALDGIDDVVAAPGADGVGLSRPDGDPVDTVEGLDKVDETCAGRDGVVAAAERNAAGSTGSDSDRVVAVARIYEQGEPGPERNAVVSLPGHERIDLPTWYGNGVIASIHGQVVNPSGGDSYRVVAATQKGLRDPPAVDCHDVVAVIGQQAYNRTGCCDAHRVVPVAEGCAFHHSRDVQRVLAVCQADGPHEGILADQNAAGAGVVGIARDVAEEPAVQGDGGRTGPEQDGIGAFVEGQRVGAECAEGCEAAGAAGEGVRALTELDEMDEARAAVDDIRSAAEEDRIDVAAAESDLRAGSLPQPDVADALAAQVQRHVPARTTFDIADTRAEQRHQMVAVAVGQ
jgi:hypothetical protein